MSREALAVAHSDGKLCDVVIAAGMVAKTAPLGLLILRYLDNGDISAKLRVKAAMGRSVAQKSGVSTARAHSALNRVLTHLRDRRCMTCGGSGDIAQANGVRMPCRAEHCYRGMAIRLPRSNAAQDVAMRVILGEIGVSLGRMDRLMS